MKKKILITALFLTLLAGCNSASANTTQEVVEETTEETTTEEVVTEETTTETVTTNIQTGNTYNLSGDVTEPLVINSNADVKIVLDDVTYTGSESFISIEGANSVTLEVNGESTIEVTGDNDAIYSKDDIDITGSGVLNITSNSDAIHVNDSLSISDITLVIDSNEDGIDVNNNTTLSNTNITINTDKDGFNLGESDNTTAKHNGDATITNSTLNITCADDGIKAYGVIETSNSEIDITSGGGYTNAEEHYSDMAFGQMGGWKGFGMNGPSTANSSGEINYDTSDSSTDESTRYKGISAKSLTVVNTNFKLNTQDDAINVDDEFIIESGEMNIQAGDDAIHSDNTITIKGGNINIETCWEGLEANTITMNDGEVYVYALDDGLNANGTSPVIQVNGGTLNVDMGQGDTDALDSNGYIYLDGGTININAQSPFDYDAGGRLNGASVTVNGSKVTEIYNQFGGMGNGGQMPGGQMPGGHGMRP